LFCGAGGSSTGIMDAAADLGRRVDLLAINHWPRAIETHSANHPGQRHICADLDSVDPRKVVPGGRLHLLSASPECTHHSSARGGKPVTDQKRASAWHVLRWAESLYCDSILVENVPEFQSWGPIGADGRPLKSKRGETFKAWLRALESLGYRVEHRILNAADYGEAQTRRRLFVLATRGRRRIVWPDATHAAKSNGLPKWRAAREVIDWNLEGASIFGRKKPLAAKTMRRIVAGLERFGGPDLEPFLVVLRGTGTARSVDKPLPAITSGGNHLGLAEPFLVTLTHGGRVHDVAKPLPTITGANRGEVALVQPFMLSQQSGGAPRSTDDPSPTVAAKGAVQLVEPFLVPMYGEGPKQKPRTHDVDAPMPAVPATGGGKFGVVEPFLVRYNGGDRHGLPVSEPLPTVTSKDRFGLVVPKSNGLALDIRFRMLQPHELSAAQGFPDSYTFAGNKGERVKQIGNAVPVNVARALARGLLA
jgi:DNA (cytosine-5)-methyltransferase 1